MNVEIEAHLDKFRLRHYQKSVWDSIMKDNYKKVILVAARRSGKDFLGWNLAIRQAILKSCLVFYVLPTYSQARKAIFDAISIDGTRFLDFVPPQLIDSINQSEMKIRFKHNNSILQCIGGDSFNTSIIGCNPYAVIFSEYSRMVDCYPYVRPILAANGGWSLFATTPFGKNHFYSLYEFAKELPDWKVFNQPVTVTKHISEDVLELERQQMAPELFAQEWLCDFTKGVEGSYYGVVINQAKNDGRICPVAWEPHLPVHSAWDIGVSDNTTILFFQCNSECTAVRIIDCYSNNNMGIDHYAKVLQSKPYTYGTHFGPHDLAVREWGGGAVTRKEKASELGIDFVLVDNIPLNDGIDNVLACFNKLWIDDSKCKSFVDAIENYYREWNEERQIFKNRPVHNFASHYADTLRYLCIGLSQLKKGYTADDLAKIRREALYGNRVPYYRR